jgi:hypothetical protein
LGCAAGFSTSIQTAAAMPIMIASRARRLLARNAGLRGTVTDDSVVDGLLASALVDVAWMAEPVNVHPRIAFPDSRSRIRRANCGLIMIWDRQPPITKS